MRKPIKVHALPHVAGEAVGFPGQDDSPPARVAGSWSGEVKRAGQAPADGGDTPVAVDAGYRPGGEPETPADHRDAFSRASSPRSTTRPGSVRRDRRSVRRRLTAWRTP